MIAEVIPLARLPKNLSFFDYEVPQNFEGQIKIGQIVKIPLRGKSVSGLVFTIKEKLAEKFGALKPIAKILDIGKNIDAERLSLLQWLADYYLVSPALVLKTFLPEPPQKSSTFKSKPKSAAASLGVAKTDMEEIQENVKKISSLEKSFFLFHYSNHKNKLAVILKVAEREVRGGKSVLIFEPQIPDIAATLPYFEYLFPGKVATLHGEMSKTEYWQEWQRIKNGGAQIVIGTRSALFAPIQNIGLIIVDNEESSDFKQSDQNPRFDLRDAVLKLGKLVEKRVIFTSQSPRPETYFLAVSSPEAEYLPPKLPLAPPATLLDMNDEIKNKNFSSLSGQIKEKISGALSENKKVVLILNRRGLSTMILCRDCDYIFRCKNCQMPLACHDDECNLPSQFVCHDCGATEPVQLVCPKCHGASIKYLGTGTQTVEKEIKKIFPATKILRIDKDAEIKELAIKAEDADILIGTQFFVRNYLVKIKNVGLVGIVSADTLIFRPDFRSGKKIFSWLVDLINFAHERKSLIIVQTFFPSNFVVQTAVNGKYDDFYKEELENRKMLHYPPFGRLIKIVYSFSEEKKCAEESAKLLKTLLATLPETTEISSDEKPRREKKKFFSKIIVRSSENEAASVREILKKIVPDDWTIDIDPESLL